MAADFETGVSGGPPPPPAPLQWRRGGEYWIESGDWRIALCRVGGVCTYTVFGPGGVRHGHWHDPAAARAAAARLAAHEKPGTDHE